MFSAPDEKSTSNFRGVWKAGWPNLAFGDSGAACRGCEKRKGCEFGSRSAGSAGFLGESNALYVPVRVLEGWIV